MSGQGDWSPGLRELHPKGGIHGANPHAGRWAQTAGVHGGGHQTVPLARLSEEDLGVGAEGIAKANYNEKALEVRQEQGWERGRSGSDNGKGESAAWVKTLLGTLPRASGPSAR